MLIWLGGLGLAVIGLIKQKHALESENAALKQQLAACESARR